MSYYIAIMIVFITCLGTLLLSGSRLLEYIHRYKKLNFFFVIIFLYALVSFASIIFIAFHKVS